MKRDFFEESKQEKFSIRKLAIGAASVAVGATIFSVGTPVAHADEDNQLVMGAEVIGNESNVKNTLTYFENPNPSVQTVQNQITSIEAEKEVTRNPNDYTSTSYHNYQQAVETAVAQVPAAQEAVAKVEEIQSKADAYRQEMETLLPPEIRKDINYNTVTQDQKRAINNRLKEMFKDVNYRKTYESVTTSLDVSYKNMERSIAGLQESAAKMLADDGTFDVEIPERDKIKIGSFINITDPEQTKVTNLILEEYSLDAFSPSIIFSNGTAIITYDDKSVTRLALDKVAVAEKNDKPIEEPKAVKTLLATAIENATEAAKTVDTSDKTEASVAKYTQALETLASEKTKAEGIYADDKATQPQVDEAVRSLNAAVNAVNSARAGLVNKPVAPTVNKTALEKAIAAATEAQKPADTAGKTEDSVAKYTAAQSSLTSEKSSAEQVNANSSATQPQVDEAVRKLNAAVEAVNVAKAGLVNKPVAPTVNKTALEKAIAAATEAQKPADTAGKTEDSVAKYTAAQSSLTSEKSSAEQVNANSSATQPQVDEAVRKLNAAVEAVNAAKAGLVNKPVTPTPQPEPKPVETMVPKDAPVQEALPSAKVSTKQETRVEVIKYETIRRENAELTKGETKTVQTGDNGSRTVVTETVTIEGVVGEPKVISDTTKVATPEIIEVGTKESTPTPTPQPEPQPKPVETMVPKDAPQQEALPTAKVSTKQETRVEVIPFETIRRENGELAKGETKKVQTGVNGSRTVVTETVTIEGVVGEPKVISDTTKVATPEIIEVGTKESTPTPTPQPEPQPKPVETMVPKDAPQQEALPTAKVSTKQETRVEVIPFETIRRENGELAKGETKKVQTGVNGSRTVVTETVTIEGVVGQPKVISDTTKAATPEIIEVGTKESTPTPTPQPKPVETMVPDNAPVQEELPKAKVSTRKESSTEVIKYETIRRENAELAKGETKQVQAGVNGERRIVTETLVFEGVDVETKVILDETRDAVPEIIEVGTKEVTPQPTFVSKVPDNAPVQEALPEAKVSSKQETRVEVIPFKTIRRENAELAKGETKKVQTGVNGSRTVVIEIVTIEGVAGEPKVISDTTKEATPEIIEVGTKEVTPQPTFVSKVPDNAPVQEALPEAKVSSKHETRVEVIPFKTIRRENAELAKGETKKVQTGVNGSRTVVTETVTIEGVVGEPKVISDTTKAATPEIIEMGTKEVTPTPQPEPKPVETMVPKDAPVQESLPEAKVSTKQETRVEVIKYETIRRENSELAKGETKIVQTGVNGSRTVVTETVTIEGVVGEPKVISDTTKDATPEIIEVGTKEVAPTPQPKPQEKPSFKVPDYAPVEPALPEGKVPTHPEKVEPGKTTPQSLINTGKEKAPTQGLTATPSVNKSEKASLPNTGTESNTLLATGLTMLAATAGAWFRSKKKED